MEGRRCRVSLLFYCRSFALEGAIWWDIPYETIRDEVPTRRREPACAIQQVNRCTASTHSGESTLLTLSYCQRLLKNTQCAPVRSFSVTCRLIHRYPSSPNTRTPFPMRMSMKWKLHGEEREQSTRGVCILWVNLDFLLRKNSNDIRERLMVSKVAVCK